MHHVRVALDIHESSHLDRVGQADAGEIVAGEVDQHHVLGPLLLATPAAPRPARRPAARSWPRGRVPAIGRSSHSPSMSSRTCVSGEEPTSWWLAAVEQEHVGRGVDRPQRPVDRERRGLGARAALAARGRSGRRRRRRCARLAVLDRLHVPLAGHLALAAPAGRGAGRARPPAACAAPRPPARPPCASPITESVRRTWSNATTGRGQHEAHHAAGRRRRGGASGSGTGSSCETQS